MGQSWRENRVEGSGWVSGSLPQTLEAQLAAARKGRRINEEEIPPPVAVGKRSPAPQETTNRSPDADPPVPPTMLPGTWRYSDPVLVPKVRAHGLLPTTVEGQSHSFPVGAGSPRCARPSSTLMPPVRAFCFSIDNPSQPETSLGSPGISAPPSSDPDPRALLLARQREYKVAALSAKRAGDLDRARELMRIGKVGHLAHGPCVQPVSQLGAVACSWSHN